LMAIVRSSSTRGDKCWRLPIVPKAAASQAI
jgi:hypothetical protein